MKAVMVLAVVTMTCFGASGGNTPLGSGHWEGTFDLPDQKVDITVDLARNERGEWTGSMNFPGERLEGIELADIKISGRSVFFASKEKISGVQAEISEDGVTMKGGFLVAFVRTVPVPLTMRRVSDAKVTAGPPSTPVGKDLAGTWSGEVKYGHATSETELPASKMLSVRVTIDGSPGGAARGTMTNPFDSAKPVALTTVAQQGAQVRFEARSAMTVFTGVLRGNEIAGEWKQFGADAVPLTLKKMP